MKLKYDFVINNVAGSALAVPVGKGAKDFKGYIKLNDTAAYIFGGLQKGDSREVIVAGLLKEFTDVTEAEAAAATDAFIEELKQANVLEDE